MKGETKGKKKDTARQKKCLLEIILFSEEIVGVIGAKRELVSVIHRSQEAR